MFLTGWKEWTIAGFTALGIYSLYWMGGAWNKGQGSHHINESYEMVRAKDSFWGRFDLSNREVEYSRTGERPSQHPVAQAAQPIKTATGKVSASPAGAKKVDPKAKDPKLAKAEAAKKKAALAKQQALAKKNAVSVRVIGESAKSNSGNDFTKAASPQQQGNFVAAPAAAAPAAAAPADDQQDTKMSAGQWYSLLQAQPTMANAKKFFEAKSQIGEKAYYDILSKLLHDSQVERQKMALTILNADVSIGTFKFIVTAPADLQKTDLVAQGFQTLLQSYGRDRSRFLVLAQALASAEPQVVIASQGLIQSSIATISSPTTPPVATTNTTQSGGRVSTLSKSDFNIFKPALARLLRNQNQQIADTAKSIYVALWQQMPEQAVAGN